MANNLEYLRYLTRTDIGEFDDDRLVRVLSRRILGDDRSEAEYAAGQQVLGALLSGSVPEQPAEGLTQIDASLRMIEGEELMARAISTIAMYDVRWD
jgi:hypothetical protein